MVRSIHKLTSRNTSTNKPGRYSDGGGLYLIVRPSSNPERPPTRKWVFTYTRDGRKREMGLGSAAVGHVSLAEARKNASAVRTALQSGHDPFQLREKARQSNSSCKSFGELADEFIALNSKQWRNKKHRDQWRMTMREYARAIREKAVDEITTSDVLGILKPIWESKPETASRVRGRIERILNSAKAQGLRTGENPAAWKGHLENILPPRKKLARGHHPAMPYSQVPEFINHLRLLDSMVSLALEFTILTASRTGEVLGAQWGEIDLENKVWIVPAERMKAGREHRVPLSARCMEILQTMWASKSSEYVFPGKGQQRGLSNMTLTMLVRRYCDNNPDVGHFTVHGFRSSFRDWAAETTDHPSDVAEMCLAHVVGSAVERAYRRSDMFEKRECLMSDWLSFLYGPSYHDSSR